MKEPKEPKINNEYLEEDLPSAREMMRQMISNQGSKVEKFTIADIHDRYKRIGELLEKAKTIPDSHWQEIDDVVKSLEEVENYLEGNIGSED